MKIILVMAAILLAGCSAITLNSESPEDKALKLCGLGISQQAQDTMKLAIQKAADNPGADFTAEANKQIETQVTILLKQADLSNDKALAFVAEEMKRTRDCAVNRVALEIPISKSELQEACRIDVQRKLTPTGREGTLRNWNTADGKLIGNRKEIEMSGYFDRGGCKSASVLAVCDFNSNRFNEAVITRYEPGC
ncbi:MULTISPECIES: hypothetical protein [Aeromonas]|jgi:hypothetical protein|uniref:hypothetical protein n=1 Tax=Aeromonas TaxID=642 RepID=UPI002B480091|nr:hypothetical protein [Aeromonas hydrophila]